jgi:hypothetical protein
MLYNAMKIASQLGRARGGDQDLGAAWCRDSSTEPARGQVGAGVFLQIKFLGSAKAIDPLRIPKIMLARRNAVNTMYMRLVHKKSGPNKARFRTFCPVNVTVTAVTTPVEPSLHLGLDNAGTICLKDCENSRSQGSGKA